MKKKSSNFKLFVKFIDFINDKNLIEENIYFL